jgi:hypothetical protein
MGVAVGVIGGGAAGVGVSVGPVSGVGVAVAPAFVFVAVAEGDAVGRTGRAVVGVTAVGDITSGGMRSGVGCGPAQATRTIQPRPRGRRRRRMEGL